MPIERGLSTVLAVPNTDLRKPGISNDGEQPVGRRDVSRLDDFQVIEERQRVMAALAALTDQYRELNHEINRRETLRWMTAR
jgi:hypothetical protein